MVLGLLVEANSGIPYGLKTWVKPTLLALFVVKEIDSDSYYSSRNYYYMGFKYLQRC
jgi:hypothetical protein